MQNVKENNLNSTTDNITLGHCMKDQQNQHFTQLNQAKTSINKINQSINQYIITHEKPLDIS